MNLREEMPDSYTFIETCRVAFGVKEVNAQIRLGMDGARTFHAAENGIEVGTAGPEFDDIPNSISLERMVIRDKQPEDKHGEQYY